METFATIGDLISGRSDLGKNVSTLFTKQAAKPPPAYDYASVPARAPKRKNEDYDSNDEIHQKRPKKVKKAKKKKLIETKQKTEDKADISMLANNEQGGEAEVKKVAPKDAKGAGNRMELLKEKFERVRKEEEKERQLEPEKEARTVFVGNIPIKVKEKAIRKLFAAFGTVETVRFRSAARPDLKTTKKVAVIKQTFHEARSNINAYVRFKSREEAEKSCSLNGTELEGHAIRVDMAEGSSQHEQNKAVFLGNLDFKTSEDDVRRAFEVCGEIANVRLVRDSSTGIGKGFGYINFVSKDSVENALRLNATEVCGRQVRVNRAVRKPKPTSNPSTKNSRKFFQPKKKAGEGSQLPKKSWARQKVSSDKSAGARKQYRKKVDKKGKGEQQRSFQGITTSADSKKFKKPRWNKEDRKKKIIAEKLTS